MSATSHSYTPRGMEQGSGPPALGQPVRGYSRAEVDDFLAAAARERARLEAEIADANRRIRDARTAIGMHRVMVSMVLDAQRELSEMRRAAELEAERILSAAETDAQRMLAEARNEPAAYATHDSSAYSSPEPAPYATPEPVIDLAAIDTPVDVHAGNGAVVHPSEAPARDAGDDQFFEFLRGALADNEPLGPPTE
jgi:DivIVA protein